MACNWTLQTVLAVRSDRRGPGVGLVYGVLAVACLLWALRMQAVHVMSDRRVLRIVTGRRQVELPWSDVRGVRRHAGRWGTHVVVDTGDGRTVSLPEGLDVARVRSWQHQALLLRDYPEQAPD